MKLKLEKNNYIGKNIQNTKDYLSYYYKYVPLTRQTQILTNLKKS